MDQRRFDALIRRFVDGAESRRGLLGKLSLGGFAAGLTSFGLGPLAEEVEAARNVRRCRRRCRRRFGDAGEGGRRRRCLRRCRTQAGCTKDTDCKGDRVCANGSCVDPNACSSDTQCGTGRICQNRECVDDPNATCTTPAECGVGQTCTVGGQCVTTAEACVNGACDVNEVCLTSLNICLPALGPCGTGCPVGQQCVAGFCVELPTGECQVLGTTCETTADCRENLVCVDTGDLLGTSLCLGV